MTKKVDKEEKFDIQPKVEAKPAPVQPSSFCVVCGQAGNLSETAGAASWHKACGESHPAVIAKVKARA